MIGLGAGTPSNRLRRQNSYNSYDKTKNSNSGYDSGSSSSYDSSSSGNGGSGYDSSSNTGNGGYDSGGTNYGDVPPTVVNEQYNNPYNVNPKEGNLFCFR